MAIYMRREMFKIRHTNCLNAMESHRNMHLSKDHSMEYKIYSYAPGGLQQF